MGIAVGAGFLRWLWLRGRNPGLKRETWATRFFLVEVSGDGDCGRRRVSPLALVAGRNPGLKRETWATRLSLVEVWGCELKMPLWQRGLNDFSSEVICIL
jgi:hypothetical protein